MKPRSANSFLTKGGKFSQRAAESWARRLADEVELVMSHFPEANAEDVRHTLILLRMPPWERLERSLRRGRATAVFAR
jgi:hypothetical protein